MRKNGVKSKFYCPILYYKAERIDFELQFFHPEFD